MAEFQDEFKSCDDFNDEFKSCDDFDEVDAVIIPPTVKRSVRVGNSLRSISVNSKGELCVVSVVHGKDIISFFNKDFKRIREDIKGIMSLRGATFTGTDDIVLVKYNNTNGSATNKLVELLHNWRDNQENYVTCELPSNLQHPHDCWLSKHSINPIESSDNLVLYLADTKSSIYQSRDNGYTWTALKLNPPLKNHWCAVKSGQRLWAAGNRLDHRSVLTGYFLFHYTDEDGDYELERFVDEHTADIKNFKPYNLIVDKNSHLIVVDENFAIHKFNSRGDYLRKIVDKIDFGDKLRPRYVALSSDEKELFVGTRNGYILVYDYKNE